jgi:hypothetical protein
VDKTTKSQKDCESLQEDLDAVARWESDWLMAFHPDKCSVLTITNKKHPVKHNYLLHNHTLKSVLETFTIFLGFGSFVDDAVVGEQSELAGFQIFW